MLRISITHKSAWIVVSDSFGITKSLQKGIRFQDDILHSLYAEKKIGHEYKILVSTVSSNASHQLLAIIYRGAGLYAIYTTEGCGAVRT
jgi:hypothetical protein